MENHEYFHEAMATTFTLKTYLSDESLSKHVADLCFRELDSLEMMMSRFVADSDISRINKMKAGDLLLLEEEVYRCLKAAIRIHVETGGHYDAGTAELSDIYRGFRSGMLNDFEYGRALEEALAGKNTASFYLHPDEPSIFCMQPGMKFDLGGIGKGFALDILKQICLDNGVQSFVLNAGGSTVLVHTHEEISYLLSARKEETEVLMKNGSVSASGTGKQGKHIFNPVTGDNEEQLYDRIWVGTAGACDSDAYGTAFFSMTEDAIAERAHGIPAIDWVAVSAKGRIKPLYSTNKNLV